jgi:hypothetical protein
MRMVGWYSMVAWYMPGKEAARTCHSLGMFATGAIFCRTVARATHFDALVPQVSYLTGSD